MLDALPLLISTMQRHQVSELEVRWGNETLRMSRAAPAPDDPVGGAPGEHEVARLDTIIAKAHAFGHFAARHPARDAGIEVGALVAAGDVLGFVCLDELIQPVVAPAAGRLARVLRGNGDRVDYGTPVFEIDPTI